MKKAFYILAVFAFTNVAMASSLNNKAHNFKPKASNSKKALGARNKCSIIFENVYYFCLSRDFSTSQALFIAGAAEQNCNSLGVVPN